jgi:predicted RNA-binding protein Jag
VHDGYSHIADALRYALYTYTIWTAEFTNWLFHQDGITLESLQTLTYVGLNTRKS